MLYFRVACSRGSAAVRGISPPEPRLFSASRANRAVLIASTSATGRNLAASWWSVLIGWVPGRNSAKHDAHPNSCSHAAKQKTPVRLPSVFQSEGVHDLTQTFHEGIALSQL